MDLVAIIWNIVFSWVIGVTVVLIASYAYLKSKYTYWAKRGVAGPKPAFFLGSLKDALYLKCTEAEAITAISKQYPDKKYVGLFNLWKPVLLVKDLELAKNMMVKDFQHFMDHPDIIGVEKTDSVLDSLFQMHDYRWKTRRSYFAKLFTTKKLKDYEEKLSIGLKDMINSLDEFAHKGNDLEVFRALEPTAIYSIASILFSTNVSKNEKANMLKKLTYFFLHPPKGTVIKFLCYGIFPNLFKFLRFRTLPQWHWDWSSKFADELAFSRELSGDYGNDCLGLAMRLKVEGTDNISKITYEEFVGHLYSFLQAGTHTTHTMICHVLFHLAANPHVQEKLRNKIDSALNGSKEITYDKIKKITYLENVVTESLRIYPLIGVIKRTCTKLYKTDDGLTIPEQMDIYIDAWYIHNEPKYFPEPEKFLPERWTTGDFEPSAFMPYGIGPRMCIGKRLAEMEMKMAVATIVSRYVIYPSDAMKPMKFDPQIIFLSNIPIDGVWVKIKKRENVVT